METRTIFRPSSTRSNLVSWLMYALVPEYTENFSSTRVAAIDEVVMRSAGLPAAAESMSWPTKAPMTFMTPVMLRSI